MRRQLRPSVNHLFNRGLPKGIPVAVAVDRHRAEDAAGRLWVGELGDGQIALGGFHTALLNDGRHPARQIDDEPGTPSGWKIEQAIGTNRFQDHIHPDPVHLVVQRLPGRKPQQWESLHEFGFAPVAMIVRQDGRIAQDAQVEIHLVIGFRISEGRQRVNREPCVFGNIDRVRHPVPVPRPLVGGRLGAGNILPDVLDLPFTRGEGP